MALGIARTAVATLTEISADKDQLRAKLPRASSRHPAAHAKNPGLVGSGQHDAATDGNRLAPERRVEQLLDRGIEGIEIRMQDGWFHPGRSFGRCSISRVCC